LLHFAVNVIGLGLHILFTPALGGRSAQSPVNRDFICGVEAEIQVQAVHEPTVVGFVIAVAEVVIPVIEKIGLIVPGKINLAGGGGRGGASDAQHGAQGHS